MVENEEITPIKMCKNQLMPDSGKDFFLDASTADVYFSFDLPDDRCVRVPAHKILLAVASDVFKRMFYGQLKEKGDVKIVDVSDAAYKEFLQYFYLSEVKLTAENIVAVIHLAHKYNVKNCIDDGIPFLMDTVNEKNICDALHLAILYERPELLKACETFVVMHTAAVFKSDGFLECDNRVLERILKMNVLSCFEADVFEACMTWVRAKNDDKALSKAVVDTHLGRLYDEIRFSSMTIQQFCSLAAKYDSVLRNDYLTLSNMILGPEYYPENFNNGLRKASWKENDVVKCDLSFSIEQQESSNLSAHFNTIFSTSKPLLLGSFTYRMCVECTSTSECGLSSDLSIKVKIIEANELNGADSKTLLKMMTQLQSKDTIVSLPYPVLVRPGHFYTICIAKCPDELSFYSKELKTVKWLQSDVMIKIYKYDNSLPDKKAIGLVSMLNFNGI